MAYMLALRQSLANRRQSQTADDGDPNEEGLRIDTPVQVPPSARLQASGSWISLIRTLKLGILPARAMATLLLHAIWYRPSGVDERFP